MVQDPSVAPSSGNTLGSTFDAMSAFQLRAHDKCPNETAEYGYSLDTDSGTGVGYNFLLYILVLTDSVLYYNITYSIVFAYLLTA